MKKLICFLSILFLITSACAIPSALEPTQEPKTQESKAQEPKTPEERVDALFEQYDKPSSPGVSLAVIHDGEVIYAKGYGMADLEHDVPITPDTVFYIASASKQFTAMCILMLEEEGKLSLDDDIRDYLPEFPIYDRHITIRHLIHHTSGIRDYMTLLALADRDFLDFIPEDAVYDLLRRQKELNFAPGEQYMYSNSGYFLLGMIVRSASGQSLREYAEEHIFRPLGMVSSHFHDDVTHIIKNRAFGYSPNPSGGFGNMHMRYSLVGPGGLYTNVRDVFKWDQNFYNNQLGQKGPGLIEKMQQNGKLNNGSEVEYAFALRLGTHRGLKTVSHGGGMGGYVTQFLRFPDQRFSVILLSNLRYFPPLQTYEVADIYLADLLEPQEFKVEWPAIERKEISIDPSLLDTYIGQYEIRPGVIIDVTKEDNRLMAQPRGQSKLQLFPESTTKFFLKAFDAQITFQPDKNQLILHRTTGEDVPAKRIEAITLTQDQANQYVGNYCSDELQVTYNISQDEGTLYLKIGYNPKLEMKFMREDEFYASEYLESLHFWRNEEDQVKGFELNNGRVKKLEFVKQNIDHVSTKP